ncbi:leader peptidase (prepilin peptidase)/N-methyltransferase [Sedimentibacter acidaminivorans]|uniref:Prepilin leader peptidase/N-methyltransferase n=1 Tax=Sedimentibacter acidaminivorans TaxID=913099 RepID=A0ABS4GI99_9FIRM|nr:A24 family peptidase [Sedimentibacter acidaminivorans]MBP1927332.1 leader peptidase (prepilin peptidase)/N-methyltransferase [Sedimentibacter acidaminivorans]
MTLLILLYGLIIGSFLNVCIYRIPRGESIAWPGSHCPTCSHSLSWYDNIPLFSYLLLKGKCRYCRTSISAQYPVVESLNAVLYIIMYLKFGFGADFIFYSLISSVLLSIIFIDLKEMIIPDSLVLSILALSVIHKAVNYFFYGISLELIDSFLGLILAGGLFAAIVIISRGGMGGGDVTLIGALGFVLGVKYILLCIFLSFISGAIISMVLLATKIKTRKDPIPFGPFIVLGFFITSLWGKVIINWYFNILL